MAVDIDFCSIFTANSFPFCSQWFMGAEKEEIVSKYEGGWKECGRREKASVRGGEGVGE